MKGLTLSLDLAKSSCKFDGDEEEGGIILMKDDVFEFIKITNTNTGTPTALVLYSLDRDEFGEKVLSKLLNGWNIYASFHSHPGVSTSPSLIDLQYLFSSFPRHYIYSPLGGGVSKYWLEETTEVKGNYPVFDGKQVKARFRWIRDLV